MRTRSSIAIALLIAAFCFAPALLAQDANKVIDQYVKAVGGSGKLAKVLSISIEGSLIRESDGKTGSFTFDSKTPNRYYLEIITGELPEIIAYNGKSAWHLRPDGEAVTLLGQDSKEVEAAALLNSIHLLNPKKYKIGAAVVNSTKVRGREAVTIEVTMPTGVKRQFSFDSNTHLLLRESGTTGGISQEILFDDYRPEGGIQIAHKLQLQRGNENYQIAVNRVEINQTIGERVFDFPKKSQVKLPDLKTLFAQIDANQKKLDKLKENYTGRNSSEETEMDGSGKVTRVNREEHTFFYLNGEEVSTLVAKDGKPLSASDQEKENEKTKKRIEEIQKDQAKKDEKNEKESESGKTEGKDDDDPGIEVFLRTSQFVNPRRERFHGQDVLVFDFEGNPEYKPKKLEERVVQQLSGVIWIDEKQLEVARLEAYFVKDVRFAGGLLANLQKGTSFIYEQAFVNNEVWLPTYEEVHVGVRLLLVKGFKVNEVTRYSDYQRFSVDTLSTIGKPKESSEPAAKQP